MLLYFGGLGNVIKFLGFNRIASETAAIHVEPAVSEQISAMLRVGKHIQYIAACAPEGQDV